MSTNEIVWIKSYEPAYEHFKPIHDAAILRKSLSTFKKRTKALDEAGLLEVGYHIKKGEKQITISQCICLMILIGYGFR